MQFVTDKNKSPICIIGKHIANVLKEELQSFQVVAKFATTAFSRIAIDAQEIINRLETK